MYFPKRCYDNASDDRIELSPKRALSAQEQTLLDTTVAVNNLSLDKDLGYFVTKRIHGAPCASDVHGLHHQMNV